MLTIVCSRQEVIILWEAWCVYTSQWNIKGALPTEINDIKKSMNQVLQGVSPQTRDLFLDVVDAVELYDEEFEVIFAPDDNSQFKSDHKTPIKHRDNLIVSQDEYKLIAQYHRLHTMIHQYEESYTEEVDRKMDKLLESLHQETCEAFLGCIAALENEGTQFRVAIAFEDYQNLSNSFPLLFTS